jgi:hypothetical protein
MRPETTEHRAASGGPSLTVRLGLGRGSYLVRSGWWVLGLAFLMGCGSEWESSRSRQVSRVDSAGISVVENESLPSTLPLREIGSAPILDIQTGEDTESVLYLVTSVTPLPGERIGVGIDGSKRVLIFGSDGSPIVSLGRSGEGPGEFRSVGSTVPFPADSVGVYDPRRRVLTVFDGAGRVGRVLNLADLAPRQGWSSILPIQHDFVFLGQSGLGGRSSAGVFRNTEASFRIDMDGEILAEYGEFPGVEAFAAEGMIGMRPFGASLSAATSGGFLVIGTGEEPELRYFDTTGQLVQLVRWPDHDREVTPSVYSQFVETNLRNVPEGQRQEARMRLESLPYSPLTPAY